MKPLRVALLQILPQGSLEKNLQKGIKACEEAKKAGADIALFPEMWSSGYDMPKDPEEMRKKSVPADSDFVLAFGKLAAQLEMAIAITFLERYEPFARNTLVLFDRYGKKVLTYAKVHTCDFDVERNLTPGEDFYVTDLDTAEGRVKVGAMICFDREFPENTLDEQFVQYDFPAVVTEIEQGSGAGQGGPEPGAVIPSQGRIQNVFDPSLQSRKIEGVLGGKIDEIASDGRL